MDQHFAELEELLLLQDSYLKRIIELGLYLENKGDSQQAFKVYKTGLTKTDQVKTAIAGAMLGLLD
ncbi:MAG TPA: hypothetical protein PLP88_09860 [Bacteroidales bacterium]|nr:hypothetical protein [Bacteroidales bacterium]